MSGFEGAAAAGAGKAVAKIAGKALEEDPNDKAALRQIAEKGGELEPAARAYARRLAVKEHIRLKLWQPLARMVGVRSDYFEFEFQDDMADKLKDVPEEELTTPRGSIAGPAIQGLGFTVEEPQLREMYLNLLAAAADQRVAQTAHPAFAEVIRQLDAEEARVLAQIMPADFAAIVEVRVKSAGENATGFTVFATHVLNWMTRDDEDPDDAGRQSASPEKATFVDNWIRLGLVTVDYTQHLTQEGRYDWAETTPLVVQAREQYDTEDVKRVQVQRGVLKVTEFGRAFRDVVVVGEPKQLPSPGE